MDRLIYANALVEPLKREYKKVKRAFYETSVFQAPNDVALYGALMQELGAVVGMIEDAKTIDVDAVPVRHGHWKHDAEGFSYCSECGNRHVWDYNFCPDCGARMDAK